MNTLISITKKIQKTYKVRPFFFFVLFFQKKHAETLGVSKKSANFAFGFGSHPAW